VSKASAVSRSSIFVSTKARRQREKRSRSVPAMTCMLNSIETITEAEIMFNSNPLARNETGE